MNRINLFGANCAVIAMIHVSALPATPNYLGDNKAIIEKAVSEAKLYEKCGVDALMIENMHDIPYLRNEVGHEISTLMSIIGYEIKRNTHLPCGIQILAGANRAAIAAAHSANLDFVRAEGWVFAHIADEGIIESSAGEITRYRKQIEANDVLIFTDIKKKHSSHQITEDINLVETAKAAEFFLSNGLIITGISTGIATKPSDIRTVKDAVSLPVIVGSGITVENIEYYVNTADAVIVGSHFKENGEWQNNVSEQRVINFMTKINSLRKM